MRTKVLWSLTFIILATLSASAYYFFSTDSKKISQANNCTFEVKTCSDGTNVTRIGKNCDFAKCPKEVNIPPSLIEEALEELPISTSTLATTSLNDTAKVVIPSKTLPSGSGIPPQPTNNNPGASVLTTYVSSLLNKTGSVAGSIVSSAKNAFSGLTNQLNNQADLPKNFVSEKYLVKDGNIISNDNKIIYSIPDNILQSIGTTTAGWTNTTMTVVPVGVVAPSLNAVPIKDLPGKYYLSENSFGNIENCEFSNKIFILDSISNEVTLMYEENSGTLSRDDPRACNSEIFLLATEDTKLLVKYHTLNTNSLCDTTWSEPDKTWDLDVTNLSAGMKRYYIPEDLRINAEQEEEACRAKL